MARPPRAEMSKKMRRGKSEHTWTTRDEVNMHRLRRRPERHWLATITISCLCPLLSSSSSSSVPRFLLLPEGNPNLRVVCLLCTARGCRMALDQGYIAGGAPVFEPLSAREADRSSRRGYARDKQCCLVLRR